MNIPKGFLGHVVEFWPILADAKRIGMPVSKKGIDELEEKLKEARNQLDIELQELVPDELKNLSPKRKDEISGEVSYGFSRIPKVQIEMVWHDYQASNKELSFRQFAKAKGFIWEDIIGNSDDNLCYSPRYYRIADFKPSSQQVVRYIEWKSEQLALSEDAGERRLAKKYRVPMLVDKKKGINRKTTGNKHLQELLKATGDEVILRIIGDPDLDNGTLGKRAGIRSIDKVIKNDIVNWQPASDGAVHTTWGLTAASGQLDSRAPNILNASKHTTIGKIFRQVIEAPGDQIIVECDKKSYHVATMGYCANDKDYIRFSQLDPHSYFTSYVANGELGLPDFGMSDSEILEICARYKKDKEPRAISAHGYSWTRQNVSKVIVLGNQLGLGSMKAYLQNKKSFKSVAEVAKLQKLIDEMFPKVGQFKKAIKRQAHGTKRLVNEWGYQQHFWEVLTSKYNWEMNQWEVKPGTEAEKAIAFPVQSLAFGDIRDKLLQLRERGLLERYPFISSIHDSFIFMLAKRSLDNFIADVYPILVSPSRVLRKECCPKGLVVGVEVAWGKNFGSYDKEKNSEGMREIKI